jgi:transposase
MGPDQHRAQTTSEWVDTSTGKVSRARVAPADRAGVRRFLARFRGRRLEVALEATTCWRFVVEELLRIGAVVHLAGPADTAALRGNKKRAKNDRADARHLRELLMAGRLPASWIPPAHILDLRAGAPAPHDLRAARRVAAADPVRALSPRLPAARRPDQPRWAHLAGGQPLPACAREQVTVALAMIDALERQLAPLNKEVRSHARRQPGCQALMRHYGIGALTAVTILAAFGDPRRFSSSSQAVRFSRPGHHRASLRPATRARAPIPPRTAGAALGAVRSRPMRPALKLARPRLLPRGLGTAGGNRACLSIARSLLKRHPGG